MTERLSTESEAPDPEAGGLRAVVPTEDPEERFLVTRPAHIPGVELWQALGSNRCMRAVTEGVWIAAVAERTRRDAWAEVRSRSRQFEVRGDELGLHGPNETVYTLRTSGRLDIVNMTFDVSFLDGVFPEGRPAFRYCKVRDPALDALFWRATRALESPAADDLEREERVTELLIAAHARHAERAVSLAPGDCRSVLRAREFVDAHYREHITLDRIAKVSGMSKYHLARRFRETWGVPLHQYTTMLRIREAMRRLRQGETPGHVACACGFADQAHFTRVFRKTLGISPGNYRRREQASPTPALR